MLEKEIKGLNDADAFALDVEKKRFNYKRKYEKRDEIDG